ncbi:endolytic transglycosylase MltG [Candidatus Saccharibacteria bacterium]|nr:endolytic transglycosylase MltG [Candidatus Saccharibacteria bacterium]
MRIIGLDVGEKRIGVAKADSGTRIAVPVGFVLVDGTEWQEIARIARMNSTDWFVLGLPRSNEGNETKQSLYVRNFAKVLVEKIPGAKVRFQDESLTSVEAETRLKQRKKQYEKGEIDAEAASIILQDFMENIRNTEAKPQASAEDFSDNNSGNFVEKLAENTRTHAKKEAEKVAFETKKAKMKTKKLLGLFIIPPVLIVLILLGVTVVLKYRDHLRAEREAEYARQEAEMKAETFNFTIVPGETIFDVKKKLIEHGYEPEEVEAGLSANYDYDFLKDRPEGATLEGYLYPETHNFYADASVKDVLSKYLEGMGEVIKNNNLAARYEAQGLTLFEGITLASVVQKEAVPGEQATVAQVFLSRLGLGWKMGSDVTVSYALDVVDPNRETYTDNSAALTINSCYNTRLNTGLPCGPISNPGLSSLLAVAEPSDSSYLYFLTGDDGMMYYSYTEYEHNQNVVLHCQELCNVSL